MIWGRSDLTKWSSKYFSAKEMECKCGICHRQVMDDKLIELINYVREEVGVPITITSAFRCERWQQKLRGDGLQTAKGRSTHEMGQAVDLRCSDMEKLKNAIEKHFEPYSIGYAASFYHVDMRPGKRRWKYS